jgi:hypothetical protein
MEPQSRQAPSTATSHHRPGLRVAWLALLVVLGLGGCFTPHSPARLRPLFAAYRFPPCARLRHLGQRRIYVVKGPHITWDGFASDRSPADLARCFQRKLGRLPIQDGQDYTWRYPAADPTRFLNVIPPTARGPHQALRLPPGTRSVVILSRR